MTVAHVIFGQLAALLIALGGVLIVLGRRSLALRLVLCGACLAALSAIFAKSLPLPMLLAAALGAFAALAAILDLWHPLSRLMLPVLAMGLAFIAMAPLLEWLEQHWWILLAIVLAGALAATTVTFAVPALRIRLYRSDPRNAFVRMSERILERAFGPQKSQPKRAPHIKDFDLTRRSRRGPGPNSI